MIDITNRFSDSLIEHVNVWLNVYDANLNIIVWNPMAEKISGYSREEVVGHAKIWDWLYPDQSYRAEMLKLAATLFAGNEFLVDEETQILCKNGEKKNIAWNSRSLVDENGTGYGVITFGYDVTSRKKAEEALQKAHNELSVLYDIASVASESIDLNTILDSSLDRVLPTMKSKKGMIHLWDGSTQTLFLAASRGLPHSAITQLGLKPLDGGLISQVFSQKKPVVVPDMSNLLKISNTPAKLFHTYLGVPMRAKGKAVGVISVFGKAGYYYSPEEITLLASIADQVGVAVENARLYREAGQLAVMEERRRLARDLHDSVTQSLFSLTLFAEAGQRLLRSGQLTDAEMHLGWLGETAQDALKEMRLLVYELRPLALNPGGLVEAIQQRFNAVERRAGIKAHLIADQHHHVELPLHVEEGFYRIIQEALNNSLKHASATSVSVELFATDAEVMAKITDNGVGFNVHTAGAKGGLGLISMQERAEKMEGQLDIRANPRQGTTITVRWQPVDHPAGEKDS
jgi:PAS domain S-box-containing protein